MGYALSIVIILISGFALGQGVFYFRTERNGNFFRTTMLFMGGAVALWGYCYGAIGLTQNLSLALIERRLGLLGVVLYLTAEVNLFIYLANIKRQRRILLRWLSMLLGAAEWVIFSSKNTVEFVKLDGWTTWRTLQCPERIFHNLYLFIIVATTMAFGLIWYHRSNYVRDKRFSRNLLLSNIAMFAFSIPDSFALNGTGTAYPTSALGGIFTYWIIYYISNRYNTFSISSQNLYEYIGSYVEAGIMIFRPDRKLEVINNYAKNLLRLNDEEDLRSLELTDMLDMGLTDEELDQKILTDESTIPCSPSRRPECKVVLKTSGLKDRFGEPLGLIVTMYDITKEEELVRQAEAANEAKTVFLASVSHEVRTPINVILGMNEVILRESREEDTLDCARSIDMAGQMLLTQINEILDSAKMDAGKLEIVPENYKLHKMIAYYQAIGANQTASKNLEFRLSFDEKLPENLYGDEFRVRQIVSNLFSNAVKYTKTGCVSISFREETRTEDQIVLRIEVKDTGIGIRESDIDALFQSFSRFDLQKNKAIQGTGLGLAIVKQLTEMMKGEIRVESKYGEGSNFIVLLPQKIIDREETLASALERAEKESDKEKGGDDFFAPDSTILVADDIEMNRRVIGRLLRDTGINIDYAENGKVAYQFIRQKAYDVIFLDHRMPEMDGLETLKAVKADPNHPNQKTPMVILTANALEKDREMYFAIGFDEYLCKPVNHADLTGVLGKYIKSKERPKTTEQLESESFAAFLSAAGVKNSSEPDVETKTEALAGEGSDREKRDGIFGHLDFLDPATALRNCMNDMNFVKEMLEAFVEDERSEDIDKAYEAGNWEEYELLVHGVKGTSRTIGALDFGEEAYALELAEKRGDLQFIHTKHEEFLRHYKEILEQIKEEIRL